MRQIFLPALLLALLLGLPATAQSVPGLSLAKPAAAAPAASKPAAAPAPTPAIIPGSPLAALTGAAPPKAAAPVPAPFGTDNIGLSLTRVLGGEAERTIKNFVATVQRSTRLTPIARWLSRLPGDRTRRAEMAEIGLALLLTLVPGFCVEWAIGFALRRPRALLARRAVPRGTAPAEAPLNRGLAKAEAGAIEPEPEAEADDDAADGPAGGAASIRRISLRAWLRRLGFGTLHAALRLVPLLGFAITAQAFIWSGVVAERPAHLAVIGLVNAYLFCRLVLEGLRFLLAPNTPALRLAAMPGFRADWAVRQARLMLATGFVGYALVSISELLGLGRDGATVMVRLVALALHLELAVAIWQSRKLVGRWIAGHQEAKGILAGFRHGLGAVWHYFALFYVLALWIAWAGGVQHAFAVLLRAVLVLIAAAVLGRLAWNVSSALLERAFPDPASLGGRRTALAARARAYNPLIRLLIRVFIGFVAVVLVLQGWGVDAVGYLSTNALSRSLLGALVSILITIAVALILWECVNAWMNGRIERLTATGRTRQAARLRTLVPMVKASIGALLVLVAGYISLLKIGINTVPLLAISSVVGIAVGFGSQKLVQDIITGLFLLLEDAMQVGDVITLAGMTGVVERLSVRTIRLRGGDGSVNIIPFSAVTTVTNMTRDFGYAQISINVGYREDIDHVSRVLTEIGRQMRAEDTWAAMMRDDLQIFGLDSFATNALVITGQIRTGPGQHWAVRREFYRRVQRRFADEGIEIPYRQHVMMDAVGTVDQAKP
jgi:small conductance mechanosensitive channel